jgi:hypothetical protein
MKTVFNYNTPVAAEWFNIVNGFRLRFDGDPMLPGDMVDGQYLPIRLQDLDPAILAGYSQSLDVVSTNTDQNINGNKTFIEPVTIPSGISANHAITKNQLDSQINVLNTAIANANTTILALEAATVKLTTAQTIAGVKTFSSSPLIPPGSVPGAAVNKAQLDAFAVTVVPAGASYIITASNGTQMTNTNAGGVKFANGLKLESGQVDTNSANWSAGGAVSGYVVFSTPFTNPPKVVADISSVAAGTASLSLYTDITQPTTNTIWYWTADGVNSGGNTNKIDWIAIGV